MNAMSPVYLELFLTAFVTFFVVIDPIGVAPVFGGLTEGTPSQHRRQMAVKSVVIASTVLIGFAYLGEWLFDTLHVSLDAFRVAGGIFLFILALEMLFEKRSERREGSAENVVEERSNQAPELTDISVFPLAIPLLAGPGAIASVMLLMTDSAGDSLGQGLVLLAMGLNLGLCLLLFVGIGVVMRVIGKTGAAIITRILGIILGALSVQFVLDGVLGAVATSRLWH